VLSDLLKAAAGGLSFGEYRSAADGISPVTPGRPPRMNRFGGLGSSPAPPRPLSNGPARAVLTTGERIAASHFSSSGGSVAYPLGEEPGLRLCRPGSTSSAVCVSRMGDRPFQRHDQDSASRASRLGTKARRSLRPEPAATRAAVAVPGAVAPPAGNRHSVGTLAGSATFFPEPPAPRPADPAVYKTPEAGRNLRDGEGHAPESSSYEAF
jgi:hypothetical protein